MMLKPVLVTPPADYPLTIEEVRRQCNITDSSEDLLLDFLMRAGTNVLDGYSGIVGPLLAQTWRQDFYDWPNCIVRLALSPVSSVTFVKYYDSNGAQQTLLNTSYALLEDAISPFLRWAPSVSLPSVYDRYDAISVTYVAGYGTRAQVPTAIKQGLLMWIATMFEQREKIVIGMTVEELPGGLDTLRPYYRYSF